MKNAAYVTPHRIGIVGDGQLGRMMAMAAEELGFDVVVLGPTADSPASQYATQFIGDFREDGAVREFSSNADVVTFEIEDAHAEALIAARRGGTQVHPSPETLSLIKDKLRQKELFESAGIPVAKFRQVDDERAIAEAGHAFGYRLVLKARLGSYDGRGNASIGSADEIPAAVQKLEGRNLYVEQHVPFKRELAVVAARDVVGNVVTYPVVETRQVRHICHTVIAPAAVTPAVADAAKSLAVQVMNALDGVGVFGIEMFETSDGVLVNEVAPRVHNSGHWTIEGADTSQFEQHIRAVTGLPLGSTEMTHPAAVMVNILGERSGPAHVRGMAEVLALPGVHVHLYGKKETRLDRKMGHITATASSADDALVLALTARKFLDI